MEKFLARPALDLFGVRETRCLENSALSALPPYTLMARAGLAAARLAIALAPHAQTIWVACGPGNNGGDGLEAATQLHRMGKQVWVTCLGDPSAAPSDARLARARAREAGVRFMDSVPDHLTGQDLCMDALLGIGAARPPEGVMARWISQMNASAAPILALDVPTGLHADTGSIAINSVATHAQQTSVSPVIHAKDTLCLITAKPGLFTGQGRDAAGTVWIDTLGVDADPKLAVARLGAWQTDPGRPHASHKGTFGDVAVLGGAPGMEGAAVLAASAALNAGAGRVYLAALGAATAGQHRPELMHRTPEDLDWPVLNVVCGCGGGTAITPWLAAVLAQSAGLVLDADALNVIAADVRLQALLSQRTARGLPAVLTPHPLEAARLLQCTAADVQRDRLRAAKALVDRFGVTVVLKGSGTVVATTDQLPVINPTGNARLATAGTGDVLAGLIGARLSRGDTAWRAACQAVYQHGQLADHWPAGQALTAGRLADGLSA